LLQKESEVQYITNERDLRFLVLLTFAIRWWFGPMHTSHLINFILKVFSGIFPCYITFLFIYLFVCNLLPEFWWLQAVFLVHVLSVCMCVFPCSAPHVLPNFNSPCLIHCPSLLLVNCSKSSVYGCDACFVFLLEASVALSLGCTHSTNVGEDAASTRRTVVVFAARLRVTDFRLYSTEYPHSSKWFFSPLNYAIYIYSCDVFVEIIFSKT
jgi:hypothetical protein